MSDPKPGDPADRQGADTFVAVHRNGGWTADQWLAWLERHPDATLPSGVGAMLVAHLRAQVTADPRLTS